MNTASLLMMTFVQDLTFILFVSMLARQNKIYYLIGVDFKFKQRSEDKVNVGEGTVRVCCQGRLSGLR